MSALTASREATWSREQQVECGPHEAREKVIEYRATERSH